MQNAGMKVSPDDPADEDQDALAELVARLQDFADRWPETGAEEQRNKERAMAEAEAHIGRRFVEHRARFAKLSDKP